MIDYDKAKILLVNLYATKHYNAHLKDALHPLMTPEDYIGVVGPRIRDIHMCFEMAGIHVNFILDCLDQLLGIDVNKLKLKHIPMEYHMIQLQSIYETVESNITALEEVYLKMRKSNGRLKSLRTTLYEYVEDYFDISTFRKIKWN